MKVQRHLMRLMAGVAPVIAVLAMAAPPATLAAAPTILIDADNPANDCGSFTNKTSAPDPVAAINGAATGSTIIICPGTYTLTGEISITNKKLTIKRAMTSGTGSRPILDIDDAVTEGVDVETSTITIDGLIIDGKNNPAGYTGIRLTESPAIIKNTTILGPDSVGSNGVLSDAFGSSKLISLSISNTTIVGYRSDGVVVVGPVKLSMTSCHLDARDGGRVPGGAISGIQFVGDVPGVSGPTGSVIKSRILNNQEGISIGESSKVSITNNVLSNNTVTGVRIRAIDIRNADNTKITGNTFLGIPASGQGVRIDNLNAASFAINKFSISRNVFVADQYGSTAVGVQIDSNVAATPAITGSVTSNTFIGITNFIHSMNGPYAGVTEKGNDAQP